MEGRDVARFAHELRESIEEQGAAALDRFDWAERFWGLGFRMDCGHSYEERYGIALHDVRGLADDFCEERFETLLSRGDVRLAPEYRLPESFVQANPMTSYDKGLYEAEDGRVDGVERRMVDLLANSSRVVWWHRVVERKPGEFSINGFVNHYPDFLALRDDGVLMAIETKGEHLAEDAKRKLRLGTRWSDMAGAGFGYFMVFEREALDEANAFTLAEFGTEILG